MYGNYLSYFINGPNGTDMLANGTAVLVGALSDIPGSVTAGIRIGQTSSGRMS